VARTRTRGSQSELATEALFGLLHIQSHVVRPIDDALARAHGTTLTGFEILTRLARLPREGASVRYLSEHVVVSPSRVSRVAEELVARGLLERAASLNDGRVSLVRLTPAGRRELAAMEATLARALGAHFLGRLSPGQVAAVVEVARALGAPGCQSLADPPTI
jgi:DNA-binding MarR family transcriptional regulator